MTYRGSSGSEEDQGAEVSSSLVGKGAGSIDESANTVRLDSGANDGAAPRGSGGSSLLGVEVLLLRVGLLCATVGITENWAKNGKGNSVVEGCAESNGRRLNGREV